MFMIHLPELHHGRIRENASKTSFRERHAWLGLGGNNASQVIVKANGL
jgi:hypothetical protein